MYGNRVNLSICIVNWNTKEFLDKCLSSIIDKTYGITYEVIVVDNNSSDASIEMLKDKYSWCHVIINKENLGFAKANNQALNISKGKYVIFLNPDTELITNAFPSMIKFLDDNSQYGAAGCKLLNTDGTIQFTCARAFPTHFNQLCHFLMLNRLFSTSSFFSNEDLEYWDHNDSREIDVISGACLMVRRAIAEKLGGFDEKTFMYSEDVDLCYRIKRLNRKIYYLAEAEIMHYSGASSDKRDNPDFVPIMLRRGHYFFIQKHRGYSRAILYRLTILFGVSFRLLILLPLIILSTLINNKNKRQISMNLFKQHCAILLWSLFLIDPTHSKRAL